MRPESCPLAPALRAFLQECARAGTTNTKELARVLGRKPCTIDTMFGRIRQSLGVRSRGDALILAAAAGWIELPHRS